ncbi:hypothetical protein RFI_21994 [Reticulomyxa filosa]|uniref:Uncharacterized protein n=2 Tax=Reticulomyxa filosa TaxID=46433 RepID=X6MQN4_RETFI|nr:hypothetical protein RFI_21994 [Reticulomyxa filosa]|eukprot:ETO15370.1 hypothetical protein RFI_21994 [Reticulomyxa filosa]
MLVQNTPHVIGSRIQFNDKSDILTTLPNMFVTSELLNASIMVALKIILEMELVMKLDKRKTPDSGLIYDVVKKTKYSLQAVVSNSNVQNNDEKTADEITFENVWKKNMQARRQFVYENIPTIFMELKSQKGISAHYLLILQLISVSSSLFNLQMILTSKKKVEI